MGRIREIKKRMIAVSNIERITKTMQLIATAKFTAALIRTTATKPYTEKIRQLVAEVAAAAGDVEHPLLAGPPEKTNRHLLLVITSDRGLCGAYNGSVLRKAMVKVRDLRESNTEIILETSGKKAVGFFKFQRIPLAERHTIGDKPVYEDVNHLATRYIRDFSEGKYDEISVAYMRYETNARQIPELMKLLPLSTDAVEQGESTGAPQANYDFSPSSEELLDALLPLTVKTTLFQAFNDAVVSEQIMRMVAMKAATENAKELSKTLRRQFNRARQTQITTELMEVIAGSAALE